MSRELLKAALEYMRESQTDYDVYMCLMQDIASYLVQPEPEPVAWMCPSDPDIATAFSWKQNDTCTTPGCFAKPVPVYTIPPDQSARIADLTSEVNKDREYIQVLSSTVAHALIENKDIEQQLAALQAKRKPLSEDELGKLRQSNDGRYNYVTLREFINVARAIEAAHGITGDEE